MPEWRWLERAHTYYDYEAHRFVSAAQVRSWGNAAAKASGQFVGSLADMHSDGQLTLRDWTLLMRDEVKDAYIQQYLLGRGGVHKFTKAEAGSLGGMLREQYRYLDRFAKEIAEGKLSPAQIKYRAGLYIASSREAYSRAYARAVGLTADLPDHPGSGNTECGVNCRCVWEIDPIKEADRTVGWSCYWRLRPAEHCSSEEIDSTGRPMGCVQRAALWNPLVIRA